VLQCVAVRGSVWQCVAVCGVCVAGKYRCAKDSSRATSLPVHEIIRKLHDSLVSALQCGIVCRSV